MMHHLRWDLWFANLNGMLTMLAWRYRGKGRVWLAKLMEWWRKP